MKSALYYIIVFFFFSPLWLTAQTTTLNHTGAVQNYVIPANSIQLEITARGAQGGSHSSGATGGLGASVTSFFPVGGANPLQPGQTIFVYVGGVGQSNGAGGLGGFNGGGIAPDGNDEDAAGGGGASDVRFNGMALTDRIIIAAGGGGAGTGATNNGGNGGNNTGVTGSSGGVGIGDGAGGTGGNQATGGTGGTGEGLGPDGLDGALGIGGDGGDPPGGASGGGGGGGYYGGGGGGSTTNSNGGGGGGGSSFSSGNVTTIVAGCPSCTGNGQVTIISSSVIVPTLSEWGLIILALLIISIGVVYATQKELIVADSSMNFQTFSKFNKIAFLKYVGIALMTILIIGLIAIFNFNYEIMPFDFVGSILSAGLIGFICQMLLKPEHQ